MTINKLGMSALAASLLMSAVVANAATTGSATVVSDASTVASELLIGQDYNGTTVGLSTTFKPSLNAGVQDGKIMIEFDGGRLQSVGTNSVIFNVDGNKTVGINPTRSGANKQKLIFDVNDTINDADTLRFVSNANGIVDNNATDYNASILLDVLNGSTSVTMKYSLLDNIDSPLSNANAGIVLETKPEWEVSVVEKFDAKIDAAQGFKLFTTNSSGVGGTVDTTNVNFKHNNVAVGTGAVTWNVKTYMDTNVTASGTLVSAATKGGTAAVNPMVLATDSIEGYVADYNITTIGSTNDDYNLTFTANGTTKIDETVFKTSISALSAAGNTSFKKDYLNKSDLGQWTIYGYKGQIPNVASTGPVSTVLKFTNRSNLDTNIYFTLFDQDGTKAEMNSVDNPSLASLPHNTTGTYTAAALLDLVTKPDFNKNGSFSVEVSIPTTPSSVYGFASFRNSDAGNFKDLPIYNSSDMTY